MLFSKATVLTAVMAAAFSFSLYTQVQAASPKEPPKPAFVKMATDIYLVGGSSWDGFPNISDPGDSNVYLVDGGEELALVDYGCGKGLSRILANITAAGFDTQKINKIILTHAHYDHASGIEQFRTMQSHPIQVIVHKNEGKILSAPDHIATASHFAKGNAGDFQATNPDLLVKKGDEIRVGSKTLKVIETFGHTKGSISLTIDSVDGPAIFTGDAVIGDQNMGKGIIGWIDAHWGSDLTQYESTLKRVAAETKSAGTVLLLPGHGRPTKGAEAIAQGIKNCQERLGWLKGIPQLSSMMPL